MKGELFKENALRVIYDYKNEDAQKNIITGDSGCKLYLQAITYNSIDDDVIKLLTKWRSENQKGFTKIFSVTEESTKNWLYNLVMKREDRLLFFVFDETKKQIGHMGISSFDYENGSCEIDNVVRGELSDQRLLMQRASAALISWIRAVIKPESIKLRVLNDNSRALALYHKLGFAPVSLIPLVKHIGHDYVEWRIQQAADEKIDRFFISMKLS